jgi:hypothetical protein
MDLSGTSGDAWEILAANVGGKRGHPGSCALKGSTILAVKGTLNVDGPQPEKALLELPTVHTGTSLFEYPHR